MSALEPGSHEAARVVEAVEASEKARQRPCVVFGTVLLQLDRRDWPHPWGVRFGGLVVAGETPEEAARNFDLAWFGRNCGKRVDIPGRSPRERPRCIREPGHGGPCKPPVGDPPEFARG